VSLWTHWRLIRRSKRRTGWDPAAPGLGAAGEAVGRSRYHPYRADANARLLKVNGEGHTSMFVEPSTCRDDAELAYLVSLRLPSEGTVCNVDQLPWGLTP
jgi:hypothetical protein